MAAATTPPATPEAATLRICEPTPTLQELVDGANGFMFEINNDPDIKELQIIAAQLAKSITENAGKSGTVPMSFAKE